MRYGTFLLVVGFTLSAHAGSAVRSQLQDLAESGAQGMVPVTKVIGGLFVKGQKAAPVTFEVDGGTCLQVLGVAGRGADVQIAIFDAKNKKVADLSGETVNQRVCAAEAGKLRLEATAGDAAEVAVQAFARVDYKEDALAQSLESLATSWESGAARVSTFHSGVDKETDWNDFVLEAGKCYLYAAAAEGTVKGVSLYLYGPNRRGITNQKSKKKPEVQLSYCATESGPHMLRVKTNGGEGEYRAALFAKDGGTAPASKIKPAKLDPKDNGKDVMAGLLDDKAKVAARGMKMVGDPQDGVGKQGDMMDFEVQLDKGKCYTLVGVGSAGIRELSLYLWNPSKKRVADRKAKESSAALGHCAELDGPYHVQAKVHDGQGQFRLALYAK